MWQHSKYTYFLFFRSPVLHRQAMLTSSCSQLEAIGRSPNQEGSSIPEIQVDPSTPLNQGAILASSNPPFSCSSAAGEHGNGPSLLHQPSYLRRRAERSIKDGGNVRRQSEGFLRLLRSHSEPGLGSSTDTGESAWICLSGRSSSIQVVPVLVQCLPSP